MSPAAKPPASAGRVATPVASRPARAMPEPVPSAPPTPPAFGSRSPRQRLEASSLNDFLRTSLAVAGKEVMQHVRTKRLLIIGVAMVVLLAVVTLVFGPNLMDNVGDDGPNSKENTVLAFYFGFALIGGLVFTQLLAIVLTADAICSEWSNRTIFLLLSKPVSRTAFVTGKFLGNIAVLAITIFGLFSLDYLAMQAFYSGSPSGEEVGGFFLTVLLVILGCMAYASMAMFFSTLTRSTIQSTLLTLAMWIIILPLVGLTGFFTNIGDQDAQGEAFFDSAEVQAWLYLNPASDMQSVVPLLLPHDDGEFKEVVRFLNFFNPAPNSVGWAVVALASYTVVFFAASIAVVRWRNFD